MTRRCSHCSNNGHNSRTCPTRSGAGAGGGGVRIFGVQLRKEGTGIMKKSASMSCLAAASASASGGGGDHPGAARAAGYASDDPTHGSCSTNSRCERKKGTPWTEEEHRKFLLGLRELGKGDWRGISQRYVISRTPTQVASHAQKYFIRQSNTSRRKRRSSLFDVVPEMPYPDQVPAYEEQFLPHSSSNGQLPNLHQGPEAAEPLNPGFVAKPGNGMPYNSMLVAMVPTFYPAFIPVPYWHSRESHEIFKPTPVVAKESANSDEVVGMSKLSLKEGYAVGAGPSSLSLKLMESSGSRQSAFHISTSIPGPDLNQSSSSPIHAV